MELKRGTQVIYIPHHAYGDIFHKDCEIGFVTSSTMGLSFCRFWHRGKEGQKLRTTAYSECVSIQNLKILSPLSPKYVNPKVIEKHLQEISRQELGL